MVPRGFLSGFYGFSKVFWVVSRGLLRLKDLPSEGVNLVSVGFYKYLRQGGVDGPFGYGNLCFYTKF